VEAAAEAFDVVLVEFAPRRSARGAKIALRRTVRSTECALAAEDLEDDVRVQQTPARAATL
jgi:hypothetical protein